MPTTARGDLPDVEPERLPAVLVATNPPATFLLRQVLKLVETAGRESFQIRRPGMLYRTKCCELALGSIRMFADHDGFSADDARRVQEDFATLHEALWPRISVLVHVYMRDRAQDHVVVKPADWPTDLTGVIAMQISISQHPIGRALTRDDVLATLSAL